MEAKNSVYLYAGFPKVDAEPVRVSAVVLDQLLQAPERGAPRDEEPALIQLTDSGTFENSLGISFFTSCYFLFNQT